MVLESYIESARSLAAELAAQLSNEVEGVVAEVVGSKLLSLSSIGGVVTLDTNTLQLVRNIPHQFSKSLSRSNYYSLTSAFVVEAVTKSVEATTQLGFRPKFDQQAMEVLGLATEAMTQTLDGFAHAARSQLNSFINRQFGSVQLASLVQGTSEIMRKVSRVEPIATDQFVSFLRIASGLATLPVERSTSVSYRLVGPVGPRTRTFCRELALAGKEFQRSEIEALENGHSTNPFYSGGGFGCCHAWEPTLV